MRVIKDTNANSISSSNVIKIPIFLVSSATPTEGRIAYDDTVNQLEFANGIKWTSIATESMTVGGVLSGTLPDPSLTPGSVTGLSIADATLTSAKLTNTGVAAGTYGDTTHVGTFTVNSEGQLTSASSIAIIGGTITDINTGTGLTGGPITTTGTISLANTAVTPGTYGSSSLVPVITVNQQGQITGITTTPVTPVTTNATLISDYYVSTDTVVPDNGAIVFDTTTIQQTGSLNLGGTFTVTNTANYSITFMGVATLGQGQFKMVLNGVTNVGYCYAGANQTSAPDPVETAILGTACMTVNLLLTPTSTIQVFNVTGGDITVKGGENGPATTLSVIQLISN